MEITINQLKKISYLVILCFGTFFIVWIFFYNTKDKRYENALINIMDQDYRGIVIKKYADKNNHNSPKLVLSDHTETAVFGEFFAVIQEGDSIVKKRGDSKILVYRDKDKFTLDNKDILIKWFKKQ